MTKIKDFHLKLNLLRKLLQHQSKAFTLIEAVISLSIFCTLISVSIYGLQNYRQQIEEKQTINQFKVNWHNMLNYSYLNKRRTTFFYEYDTNTMTFNDYTRSGKFSQEIKLPKTLKSNRGHDITINVSENGANSPRTIELKSTATHRIYHYAIQMMWGELVEK
ncbi:hypothetical protein [Companilactobacillus nodensis]|uniref:hypothetical protein n=1 Tax=Companilactobacillus nodensis TaxID=460870 RepID=UPI001C3FB5F0|nr:hypothetical protein [Companilactobacillus nodensis]